MRPVFPKKTHSILLDKQERASMSPRVIFGVNGLCLELIALEIIWKNNRSLWKTFLLQYFPVFSEVKNWNTKTIESLVARVYEERKDEIAQASQLFRE